MAVYGIGAMFGGTNDQTDNFINMGVACVNWEPEDAPAVHAQLSKVKAGDVIFIKSFAPNAGLHVKAVGMVTDGRFRKITDAIGWGVSVRWRRMPREKIAVGAVEDHSDYLRRGSLYEEFNPKVIKLVVDTLIPEVGS